jgi:glycine cleavage system transcriptional repressor
MSRKIALSAVGRDRPGIVAAVTQALFEHGCNIEDSSMTILRGEFAMILIVSAPDSTDLLALEHKLRGAEQNLNLLVSFKELPAATPAPETGATNAHMISVYGADKPGIVYRVTRRLADLGVNITDVNTKMVGGDNPVYIMILEVESAAHQERGEVEDELRALGLEMSVDITMRSLETASF